MQLEARVKQDYFMNTVQAFSGLEYIKTEWRPVPAGKEEEAKKNELLEAREVGKKTILHVELVDPETEPVEEKTTKRKRKTVSELEE